MPFGLPKRCCNLLLRNEPSAGPAMQSFMRRRRCLASLACLSVNYGSVHAAYGRDFAKTGVLDPKFHRSLLAASTNGSRASTISSPMEEGAARETIEQAREFL